MPPKRYNIVGINNNVNEMTKNRFILLLMVVFALQPVCGFAQIVTRTITDVETGSAVPFATIKSTAEIVTRDFIAESDVDGKFSIEVTRGSTYTISRLGYKSITLTAERLLSDKVIKMEILPYELNTVVVTASSALSDINRAFDSVHKRIPSTPFFYRYYKKDEIISGNDTLLVAKAIIDFKVAKVYAAGKGVMIAASLKGLQVDYNNSGSEDIIPIANLSPTIPINSSLGKKIDNNTVYTRINSDDDSVTIITFHPKDYYSSREVFPSGRFIIDTRTWCILRIDLTIDNKSIEYGNHLAEISNAKKNIREHSVSIFYSANCLPSKLEQKTIYYLNTKPNDLITWTVLQVYRDITKVEYKQKPSGSYDHRKVIFKQKSVDMPDFDARFNRGFQ